MAQTDDVILIYGTAWCPDCVRAKQFLDRQHVPYKWINIEQDPQATAYVKEVNRGMRRVPTILFPDGSILVEPSNAQLADKLGKAA